MGFQRNPKWGIEIGYFHDPTTIPFSQILSTNWDNNDLNINERYRQKPTKDEMTGFPSEFSRLTGLSFSIFFDIDASISKKIEKLKPVNLENSLGKPVISSLVGFCLYLSLIFRSLLSQLVLKI